MSKTRNGKEMIARHSYGSSVDELVKDVDSRARVVDAAGLEREINEALDRQRGAWGDSHTLTAVIAVISKRLPEVLEQIEEAKRQGQSRQAQYAEGLAMAYKFVLSHIPKQRRDAVAPDPNAAPDTETEPREVGEIVADLPAANPFTVRAPT